MRMRKKGLAFLLTVAMLINLVSAAVFADGEEKGTPDGSTSAEEVIYNTGSMEITVGDDEARAEEGSEPYILFEEDGSCTIELEPDAFFPYEVQFTYQGRTTTEWFMTPEDSIEIGGHIFYVSSQQTDPTALNQIGFWVGDTYIPAYPEEKEFTNNGPEVMPASMMPLTERTATLDMTGYLPNELKKVTLSTVTNGMSLEAGKTIAAWAKWSYYDEDGKYIYSNDKYTVVDENDTIDLYRSQGSITLELIVGTADQLDLTNTRYRVTVYLGGYSNLLVSSVYSGSDDSRNQISVYSTNTYLDETNTLGKNICRIGVDRTAWNQREQTYLSMKLNTRFSALTATVYEGYYEQESDIPQDAVDITAQIWDQKNMASTGGYLKDYSYRSGYKGMPEVTIVLKRGGTTAMVLPVILYMYRSSMSLSYGYGLYEDTDGRRTNVCLSDSYVYNDYRQYTIKLENGYPANGIYYCNLQMYNPADQTTTNCGIGNVQKAVVGYYKTIAEIPSNAEDIKAKLFSDASKSGGGYGADYSKGITFTVVDTNDEIHWLSIKTREIISTTEPIVPTLPSAPTPLSMDTYFHMRGATKAADESENTSGGMIDAINAYVMPYDADSYYYNGYQTVLLLNRAYTNGNFIYSAVEDETIIPVFDTGSTVEMYAGHDGASGTKQTSGKTPVEFESGKAIQYSAAAENGVNLKNYWVTFVTQQKGPKLFVNAVNDESRYVTITDDEGNESEIPEREVFLTDEYDNHHDLFFANIGDAAITGLYVKLEDAENIALDDYWTIGTTTTLGAFTTTQRTTSYGELANVAKIRLVPAVDEDGNELAGEISGTLVIGYTGGEDEAIEEIRIHLTGVAGTPKIVTTNIVDGVKYVPYSSVIQTNNMYQSDAVTFTLEDGELPKGVILKPNGEIYGVPTVTGEFTFTVTATYNKTGVSDSKEFTLTVLDNTDDNVEATNTGVQGYELLDRVDRNLNVTQIPAEGVVFRSEGAYDQFMKFFLDGRELAEGQDYDAEEGSTRITIRAQTFRNAGNGDHTIAAEFREGGTVDGTMRSTAQNVTISGAPTNSGGGSFNSGSTASTYSVTVPTTSHGSVTVSSNKAAKGTVVTVIAKPDSGYILDTLTVTDKNGTVLELTSKSGAYTFSMPSGAVTVHAVFVAGHSVTASAVSNGSVTVTPENAAVGAVVTVITAPDEGYRLSTLSVIDADGNTLNLRSAGDGAYTFLMPDSAVTIHAVFAAGEISSQPFIDVTENAWYYEAVKFVYENGLMVGTDSTLFHPTANTSRAMLITVLYRLEGEPSIGTSTFSDVADGMWYTNAVIWAAEANILNGIGDSADSLMNPNDDVTREQVAAILCRYANYKGIDVTGQDDLDAFADAGEISNWAVEAMKWAVDTGLMEGKGNGVLDPGNTASRAEIATLLMRFVQYIAR